MAAIKSFQRHCISVFRWKHFEHLKTAWSPVCKLSMNLQSVYKSIKERLVGIGTDKRLRRKTGLIFAARWNFCRQGIDFRSCAVAAPYKSQWMLHNRNKYKTIGRQKGQYSVSLTLYSLECRVLKTEQYADAVRMFLDFGLRRKNRMCEHALQSLRFSGVASIDFITNGRCRSRVGLGHGHPPQCRVMVTFLRYSANLV